MNFTLFKLTIKNNIFIWVIFTAITLGYLMLIIGMYNPESMEYFEIALKMVPADVAAAVGMDKVPTSLVDFAANYFYGFLIQLFLLVHVSILPIRLVVKEVDDGSMGYLLSTKVSRVEVIFTKALYLGSSLLAMVVVLTLAAMFVSAVFFPGYMDHSAFISLNITTFLVALAMAAIVFYFSSIFDQSYQAIYSGVGILVTFFIMSLVARYGHFKGFYGILGNISIFRFLDSRAIINGDVNMLLNNGILVVIIFSLFSASVIQFSRRDLPL